MKFSLARLRKGHLVLATALYWAGLAAVTLVRPIMIAWRLTHLPDNHGTIDAGFTNSLFHITMTQDGSVVWSGQAYLAVIFGWMFGPPALLIAAWWSSRKALADAAQSADGPAQAGALGGADAGSALPPPSLADRLSQAERDAAARRAEARTER